MFSTAEMLSECFQFYRYIGGVLRSGAFPLWDPYHYFPFASLTFPAVFYPFNIIGGYLSSFLNFDSTFYLMQAVDIFHFFLASAFMFLFLRQFNVKASGAILGAVIFAYSGFVIIGAQSIYFIQAMAWFPLAVLFFFKGVFSIDKRSINFMLAGLFLSLSILGGFITVTIYMCAVLVFCAIWFSARRINNRERLSQAFSPMRGLLITLITAIGLSSVQLIPAVEYFSHSVRMGINYDLITEWGSTPAFHFISAFIPHFFGGSGAGDWAGQILGVGFYVFFYYTGLAAMLLLFFSIFMKIKNSYLKEIHNFLFFLVLLSLFLIMGKKSAVFGWLYSLPVLPVTRIPTRWAFFLDFAIAALSGMAFSAFLSPLCKKTKHNLSAIFKSYIRPIILWLPLSLLPLCWVVFYREHFFTLERILYFTVFFYLFFGLIYYRLFKRFKRKYNFVFIAIACLDLFVANAMRNPCAPILQPPERPSKNFQDNPIINFIKNDPDIFRVSGLQWPINCGQANQIFTLGYTGGSFYQRFGEFRGQNYLQGSGSYSWFELRPQPLTQLIDFYNVKYLITEHNLSGLLPQKYESVSGLTGVYRNKNCFPRAFLVFDFEVMPDSRQILERMEQVDLSRKAILEEWPGFIEFHDSSPYKLTITSYKTQEIELEADLGHDGLLIMSEVYFPGWHAYVDSYETKIFRANYVFRAIKLTPGFHKVKFVYSPLSVKIGLFITTLTLFVISLVFIVNKLKQRQIQ